MVRAVLREYFLVDRRASTLHTEITAGVSLFFALSYVFVVNPLILAKAGGRPEVIAFATAVVAGIATIVMGLWARLPFGLAPGMEMNSYLALTAVQLGLAWTDAMGAVFWSGVAFVVVSVSGVRERLLSAIPAWLRLGLSVSVGLFIAIVAIRISGVAALHDRSASVMSTLSTISVPVAGFCVIWLLHRSGVKAAVLISVGLLALVLNLSPYFSESELPIGAAPGTHSWAWPAFGALLNPRIAGLALVLFVIDFFGSVAKLVGLAENTSLVENGRVPRMREALLTDSLGTTAGGLLGTSNLTVYVESGVAIAAGGRTGLVAVVCGSLMLAFGVFSRWLLPLIPIAAVAGALLWVTWSLIPTRDQLRALPKFQLAAIVVMQVTVLITEGLDRALLLGLVCALAENRTERRALDPVLTGSAFLILVTWIWQVMG
jgi:adenine/guanine/hypoxanthine permease